MDDREVYNQTCPAEYPEGQVVGYNNLLINHQK